MKKVVLGVLGLVVVVLVVGGSFLALKTPAQRPAPKVTIHATPQMLARGKYLVEHVSVCVSCHSKTDEGRWAEPIIAGTEGAGGECWNDKVGFPGVVCAKNITPDPVDGIGKWTAGEIMRAIREGVDANGKALFPVMPYDEYRVMSDADAMAVVAYLRTLPAKAVATPARELHFPVSILVKFMPEPLTGKVTAPSPTDTVAYGKYLTTIGSCAFCHTPVDGHQEPIPSRAFAGGHVFKTTAGGEVASANLTPDPTGITGVLSKAQFIALFKAYDNPSARNIRVNPKQNTVMPWLSYAGMTESDLGAIYDYLRTLKPMHNVVKKFPHPTVVSAVGTPAAH